MSLNIWCTAVLIGGREYGFALGHIAARQTVEQETWHRQYATAIGMYSSIKTHIAARQTVEQETWHRQYATAIGMYSSIKAHIAARQTVEQETWHRQYATAIGIVHEAEEYSGSRTLADLQKSYTRLVMSRVQAMWHCKPGTPGYRVPTRVDGGGALYTGQQDVGTFSNQHRADLPIAAHSILQSGSRQSFAKYIDEELCRFSKPVASSFEKEQWRVCTSDGLPTENQSKVLCEMYGESVVFVGGECKVDMIVYVIRRVCLFACVYLSPTDEKRKVLCEMYGESVVFVGGECKVDMIVYVIRRVCVFACVYVIMATLTTRPGCMESLFVFVGGECKVDMIVYVIRRVCVFACVYLSPTDEKRKVLCEMYGESVVFVGGECKVDMIVYVIRRVCLFACVYVIMATLTTRPGVRHTACVRVRLRVCDNGDTHHQAGAKFPPPPRGSYRRQMRNAKFSVRCMESLFVFVGGECKVDMIVYVIRRVCVFACVYVIMATLTTRPGGILQGRVGGPSPPPPLHTVGWRVKSSVVACESGVEQLRGDSCNSAFATTAVYLDRDLLLSCRPERCCGWLEFTSLLERARVFVSHMYQLILASYQYTAVINYFLYGVITLPVNMDRTYAYILLPSQDDINFLKVPACLHCFSSFVAEKRGSYRGYIDMRYMCAIASTRRAHNSPPSRTVGFTRRFHTLSSIHSTNTSLAVVPQSPVVVHTSLRSRTLGQATSVKDCRPLGCVSREHSCVVAKLIGNSTRREEVCDASKSRRCLHTRDSKKGDQDSQERIVPVRGEGEVSLRLRRGAIEMAPAAARSLSLVVYIWYLVHTVCTRLSVLTIQTAAVHVSSDMSESRPPMSERLAAGTLYIVCMVGYSVRRRPLGYIGYSFRKNPPYIARGIVCYVRRDSVRASLRCVYTHENELLLRLLANTFGRVVGWLWGPGWSQTGELSNQPGGATRDPCPFSFIPPVEKSLGCLILVRPQPLLLKSISTPTMVRPGNTVDNAVADGVRTKRWASDCPTSALVIAVMTREPAARPKTEACSGSRGGGALMKGLSGVPEVLGFSWGISGISPGLGRADQGLDSGWQWLNTLMLGGDVLEESNYWNQAAILPVLGKVRILSYEGAQVWSAKKRTHLLIVPLYIPLWDQAQGDQSIRHTEYAKHVVGRVVRMYVAREHVGTGCLQGLACVRGLRTRWDGCWQGRAYVRGSRTRWDGCCQGRACVRGSRTRWDGLLAGSCVYMAREHVGTVVGKVVRSCACTWLADLCRTKAWRSGRKKISIAISGGQGCLEEDTDTVTGVLLGIFLRGIMEALHCPSIRTQFSSLSKEPCGMYKVGPCGMYKVGPCGMYKVGPCGVYRVGTCGVYRVGPYGMYKVGPCGMYNVGPCGVYRVGPCGVYRVGPCGMYKVGPCGMYKVGPCGMYKVCPCGMYRVGPCGVYRVGPCGIYKVGPCGMYNVGPCGMYKVGPCGVYRVGPCGMYKVGPCGMYRVGPCGVYKVGPCGVYKVGPCGMYKVGPRGVYRVGPCGVYRVGPCGMYKVGPCGMYKVGPCGMYKVGPCGMYKVGPFGMYKVGPCGVYKVGPCGMYKVGPCGMYKVGPCGMYKVGPCGMYKVGPCGVYKVGPCGMYKVGPCGVYRVGPCGMYKVGPCGMYKVGPCGMYKVGPCGMYKVGPCGMYKVGPCGVYRVGPCGVYKVGPCGMYKCNRKPSPPPPPSPSYPPPPTPSYPPPPSNQSAEGEEEPDQSSLMLSSTFEILKTAAAKLNKPQPENDEITTFFPIVTAKVKGYSPETKKAVEHAVFDILMKADTSYYERPSGNFRFGYQHPYSADINSIVPLAAQTSGIIRPIDCLDILNKYYRLVYESPVARQHSREIFVLATNGLRSHVQHQFRASTFFKQLCAPPTSLFALLTFVCKHPVRRLLVNLAYLYGSREVHSGTENDSRAGACIRTFSSTNHVTPYNWQLARVLLAYSFLDWLLKALQYASTRHSTVSHLCSEVLCDANPYYLMLKRLDAHWTTRCFNTFWRTLGQSSAFHCDSRQPMCMTPNSQLRFGVVPDDAADRWVFSGIFRFPRLCISAPFHSHLFSPSSALKGTMSGAAQISSVVAFSQNAVANQTQGPFPEPGAASQRATTPTSLHRRHLVCVYVLRGSIERHTRTELSYLGRDNIHSCIHLACDLERRACISFVSILTSWRSLLNVAVPLHTTPHQVRTSPLTGSKSGAGRRPAPRTPIFLERCARVRLPRFWEFRECRQWRDLLASQTSSRLLEFPIRLATTQSCSGETGRCHGFLSASRKFGKILDGGLQHYTGDCGTTAGEVFVA
ncbi:hypothetical protein PR048_022694 [Dryococelus australis]|uniref:Uncharacterized protein n=1 Tax=Dryococelus australis TaxID=614101 RepID=A0ABQ9GS00_9NEOP|nr:hypothetical protein PR048_022694 [Dryococelus australis]